MFNIKKYEYKKKDKFKNSEFVIPEGYLDINTFFENVKKKLQLLFLRDTKILFKKFSKKHNLYVINAEYIAGFKLKIYFNSDVCQIVDFESWLKNHPHPSYDHLNEIDNFKKFYIDEGMLVWDENWNLVFHPVNLLMNDLDTDFENNDTLI